jgi:hypothetical protein
MRRSLTKRASLVKGFGDVARESGHKDDEQSLSPDLSAPFFCLSNLSTFCSISIPSPTNLQLA